MSDYTPDRWLVVKITTDKESKLICFAFIVQKIQWNVEMFN